MNVESNEVTESDKLVDDRITYNSSPANQKSVLKTNSVLDVTSKVNPSNDQNANTTHRSSIKRTKKYCKPKKKSLNGIKQIKKTLKGKLPSEITICNDHEKDDSTTVASDSEEGEDSSPVVTAHGEPSLGSTILDEILSEKKKALLESYEMIEFLQNHVNSKPS